MNASKIQWGLSLLTGWNFNISLPCVNFWQLYSASAPWWFVFTWPHGFFLHTNNLVFSQSLKGIPLQISDAIPQNVTTSSPKSNLYPLNNTAMLCLGYLGYPTCTTVCKVPVEADCWGYISFVSLLSEITALHCLLSDIWTQLFHLFCPVFQMFVVESKPDISIIATQPAVSILPWFLEDMFCWVLNCILTVFFYFWNFRSFILLPSGLHCLYEKSAIILIIFPINVFLSCSCFQIFLYIKYSYAYVQFSLYFSCMGLLSFQNLWLNAFPPILKILKQYFFK